jgi:hypothetical protein
VFIVDVPFNPDTNGGGQEGWIFNTDVSTVADIGPEDCIFAQSKPLSITILDNAGNPTMQPYYYVTATLRRALRAYWSGGFEFNRLTTAAQYPKFSVVAMVAEHYTDDDLSYDQQVPIFVLKNNLTVNQYTDEILEPDPVTGEENFFSVSQNAIIMGIN